MESFKSPHVRIWTRPDSYFGFNPVGHCVVLTVNRDSDALDRTNWDAACAILAEAAGIESVPFQEGDMFAAAPYDQQPACYHWEASHWAVGWVRYLMVKDDAPDTLKAAADAIADRLADYPALDEDAWSELEFNEACEYWERCSVRERLEYIKDARRYGEGVSIFAARRPEIPQDDSGYLLERLRG